MGKSHQERDPVAALKVFYRGIGIVELSLRKAKTKTSGYTLKCFAPLITTP